MLNETKKNSLSLKDSDELSRKDAAVSTESSSKLDDGQASTRSTSRKNKTGHLPDRLPSVRNFFSAFKRYILCSEDDIGLQSSSPKDYEFKDKEPMFVIVDSSCLSNPSSQELLIENRKVTVLKKHFNRNVIPIGIGIPSTSRDIRENNIPQQLEESESADELQMIEINLQSENEIPVENDETDNESIVISYLQNKDLYLDVEGTLISTKKKSSILEDVPKMETILEGQQFSSFPLEASTSHLPPEPKPDEDQISESSLDAYIPSYPASPRSLSQISYESRTHSYDAAAADYKEIIKTTTNTDTDTHTRLKQAVDYLHEENEFLEAAEMGDYKTLELILSKGTNIQQLDHLGRNALHLAVCSESERAMVLLLEAGVDPNVKDNVGMTPLSLCLMRSPSVRVANLLFDHGATILSRSNPMDTGLFLQFVMMSIPTIEEEKLIRLLVEKGAGVNDLDAPGGRQALHFAAMSNNCNLIRILVSLGANLYQTNHRNETPREFALTFKCREAYSLLEDLESRAPLALLELVCS